MLAFARVAVVRLVRDRSNLFFVVVFPLLLILLIGVQFSGGDAPVVGVTADDGELGEALRAALAGGTARVEVVDLVDAAAARDAVADDRVDVAVVLDGPATDLAGDGSVTVGVISNPDAVAARSLVTAAVAEVDEPRRAARALLLAGAASSADEAAALAVGVADEGPTVSTTTVGEGELAAAFEGLGQFDLGASSQLLLFVFITALAGSATVVQVRRWGVLDRVLTGPTSPGAVIAGLGLGQLATAAIQALVIVGATAAVFGVNWGDPVATTAVVLLFAVVAAAAGLLLGAVLRNEEQANGISVPLALGLAALGGSMLPLELLPDALVPLSRLTPHAWGNLAFAEIVRRDGGLTDVLPHLGVLAVQAIVLGGAASFALRRRLAAG